MRLQTDSVRLQSSAGYRFRRVTFVYPVQVTALDGRAAALRAYSANISMGGMFIYTLQPFPPGTGVRIFLEVRGRALELGDGEVRWVRGAGLRAYPWCPGFGVRFDSLSPRSRALVKLLVTCAIEQTDRPRPAPLPGEEGTPVPGPRLPGRADGLDESPRGDRGTRRMFPAAREESPPPAAGMARARWSHRVFWVLAALATAAWAVALAQMARG